MSNRAFPVNKFSIQLSISKTLQFPTLTIMLARFRFCFRFRDSVSVSGFRILLLTIKVIEPFARTTETFGLN